MYVFIGEPYNAVFDHGHVQHKCLLQSSAVSRGNYDVTISIRNKRYPTRFGWGKDLFIMNRMQVLYIIF